MDRRAFLAVILGALPCAAANVRAQRTERVRRIGLLGVEAYSPEQRGSVRAALAERGWVEGRNLVVVERYAGGDTERLRRMADDLVAQNVDLIVSGGTVASLAAKRATSTIPTVSWDEQDRQVASLVDRILRGAKPGDLPFERPTRFEIVVNLKAAKTLGIAVPQSVLLRASEVIQ